MLQNITNINQLNNVNKTELEKSYSGNGLSQGNINNLSGKWVYQPPIFWSGRDYVRAAQLKANMLPTRGNPSNPKHLRMCRGCNKRTESLCHVLQGCPATHWSRIKRHDIIVDKINKCATKNGFDVAVEPRIRCSDGALRKPDLICRKDKKVVIVDVGVYWEGPNPLCRAYHDKLKYYSSQAFIEGVSKHLNIEGMETTIAPYILGARGTWCPLNKTAVTLLGMSNRDQEVTIFDVMKGGWSIHADFYRRTWSKGSSPPSQAATQQPSMPNSAP